MEVKTNSGPLQEQTAEELKVNILVRGGTSVRPDPANSELIGVGNIKAMLPKSAIFD